MTTFAAPVHPGFAAVPADAVANGRTASPVDSARPGATGITLVGEIVNLDTAGDTPDTSTVSVRWLGVTVHPAGDNAGIPLTPGTAPTADRPPRPAGLRGLTEGIRRLIDGPQGRHRAPR